MKFKYKIHIAKLVILTAVISGLMVACQEDIDMSNRYTFTEETVISYLQKNVEYTEYVALLNQVPVSEMSQSTVAQLLSARGHYTCFAPTNQAIADYLDTLAVKGIIDEPSWEGFKTTKTLDSIRKVIVYNSIIDSYDQDAYETANFPINDNDPFPLANMNDRKLYVIHVANSDSVFINGMALVDLNHRDIEAINGRIHEVHSVIAPSNDTMTDIFLQWLAENKGGFTVFSRLILACGLSDTLSKTRDEVWEHLWQTNQVEDIGQFPTESDYGHLPEHRKYGFTIFAEPDELYETEIGKSASQITIADIKQYLISRGAYPNATQDDNYLDENNIINQFVTYHILPEKLSSDKLVIHYNEKGHTYTNKNQLTIPVYDYYTTMGKRRLLKLFQSAESKDVYLNRFPKLQNGRGEFSPENQNKNDYHESGLFKDVAGQAMYPDENVGARICTTTLETSEAAHHNVINGCIYPIDRMLVYTENVQNRLFGERIRMDCASMFPDMINNDLRRPMNYLAKNPRCTHSSCGRAVGFPHNYRYLSNVKIEEGTRFFYLTGWAHGWSNYQMDEFNIVGRYEFTIELPPVPKKGTYELRFGVSAGSSVRSMCQVYWGPNPNYLPAAGIPMDLRIGFVLHRFRSGNQTSTFGYASDDEYRADSKLSQEEQDEIDKRLRSRGFMKGPEYYYYGTTASNDNVARNWEHVTRRIMVRAEMDPDKKYYIRFKNVLDDNELQFFMDYLEFVSKEVYDNPQEPEDIW